MVPRPWLFGGADRAGVGDREAGAGADRVPVAVAAGDDVEGARGGRPEVRVVVVVAHRVVLRVIPQPGDGVAVVVIHDDAGRAVLAGAVIGLGELDELVHRPAVERLLLGLVAVVLVAGERLGRGEPLRVVAVRVGREQALGQAVHLRRAALGVERGAVGVGRVRVGAEVVVEGDVLPEDHDQVLDRRPARRHHPVGAGWHGRGDRHGVGGGRTGLGRAGAGYRGTDGGPAGQHTRGEDGRVAATPPSPEPAIPGAITWAFAHITLLSLGQIMAPPPAQRRVAPSRTTDPKLPERRDQTASGCLRAGKRANKNAPDRSFATGAAPPAGRTDRWPPRAHGPRRRPSPGRPAAQASIPRPR